MIRTVSSKPGISVVDTELLSPEGRTQELYAVAGNDKVVFAILNTSKNCFVAIKEYISQSPTGTESLKTMLEDVMQDDLIRFSFFNKINFGFVTSSSTLVPEAVYSADKRNTILGFNVTRSEDEWVGTDHLKQSGAFHVFSLPRNIVDMLTSKLPDVSIHHHASALLEGLMHENLSLDVPEVFINIRGSGLDIVVIKSKKIILYNPYSYFSPADLAYFLLYTCEQLGLNPETLSLNVAGEIEKSSGIYEILYKYIRNIKFCKRPAIFKYSYKLDEIPSHYYHNLFNLKLCGS